MALFLAFQLPQALGHSLGKKGVTAMEKNDEVIGDTETSENGQAGQGQVDPLSSKHRLKRIRLTEAPAASLSCAAMRLKEAAKKLGLTDEEAEIFAAGRRS
jgi:hypothetical protein